MVISDGPDDPPFSNLLDELRMQQNQQLQDQQNTWLNRSRLGRWVGNALFHRATPEEIHARELANQYAIETSGI